MLMNQKAEFPSYNWFIGDVAYDDLKSPRVVGSHLALKYAPKDFIKNGGKIINIVRNPKDTAVSSYHFTLKFKTVEYSGTWDGFLDMYLKGYSKYNDH